MATASYLPDVAGAMAAGASFPDDAAARAAVDLLHGSGVRPQDLSVVTADAARASGIAGDRAWYLGKGQRGPLRLLLRRLPGGGVPKEIRSRYRADLAAGRIVLVAVAGGQPPDTLAALLTQAGGTGVGQWWQPPAAIFAPPELAGPF
ncbi:MAG TPA: hypothetical protein VM070_03250 [Candidatus Saccharimonadales bacterium]|nr:hypothetical protein [Candidatus Saccharimonadales bacterium]